MAVSTTTTEFRTLDEAGNLPDNYTNPYYLRETSSAE
jgi:hypothetical protein